MILTNNFNYPDQLVQAAESQISKPQNNVYRVTELIGPPLIRQLSIQHWDDIVIDVDSLILSMFGTAWHEFLAKFVKQGNLNEKRLFANVNGAVITGQSDLVEPDGTLRDYKTTSAWSFVLGDKLEWEHQMNCYKWLWHKEGIAINRAFIEAFLRDWSLYESMRNNNYPNKRYFKMYIKLSDNDSIEKYILNRLSLHQTQAIPCSAQERWRKPDIWAVVNKKSNRAVPKGLKNTVQEAELFLANHKNKTQLKIEHRRGEDTRCLNYCPVRYLCQYNIHRDQLIN